MPRRAIVVGSGPNGLAAAVVLARAGLDVEVFEAQPTIGGGTRSAALTLPGFTHDVCSAIHPMGIASPFFRALPLERFGLEWIHPRAPLAHPLPDGSAVIAHRSLDETAASLASDGRAWRALFAPLVDDSDALLDALLAPLLPPKHPILLARFGLIGGALRSAEGLARARFGDAPARALFAGIAAHSMLPLDAVASASFGLVLGLTAHARGWPLPRRGSQAIADALAGYLASLGGRIVTDRNVTDPSALDDADVVLLDVAPRTLLGIAGDRLASGYARRLRRFRHGPAAFKLDWALSAPIPWRAAACGDAGTVHVGGTLEDIARAERDVASGRVAEQPFVLVAQQSRFDDTRAPAGRHTAWAYCHVPNGSTVDMTARIEAQLERFAPGFRDVVLARHVSTPTDLEQHNANYVGGDIVGGANDLVQTIARPVLARDPYRIPVRRGHWFLCSASTPPGGGVHGMCGYHAARSALRAIGVEDGA